MHLVSVSMCYPRHLDGIPKKVTFQPSVTSNIHAKISACSLAEKASVNPKLCKELKLNAKK